MHPRYRVQAHRPNPDRSWPLDATRCAALLRLHKDTPPYCEAVGAGYFSYDAVDKCMLSHHPRVRSGRRSEMATFFQKRLHSARPKASKRCLETNTRREQFLHEHAWILRLATLQEKGGNPPWLRKPNRKELGAGSCNTFPQGRSLSSSVGGGTRFCTAEEETVWPEFGRRRADGRFCPSAERLMTPGQ